MHTHIVRCPDCERDLWDLDALMLSTIDGEGAGLFRKHLLDQVAVLFREHLLDHGWTFAQIRAWTMEEWQRSGSCDAA